MFIVGFGLLSDGVGILFSINVERTCTSKLGRSGCGKFSVLACACRLRADMYQGFGLCISEVWAGGIAKLVGIGCGSSCPCFELVIRVSFRKTCKAQVFTYCNKV